MKPSGNKSWKTYPFYKPSGSEWLGKIPEHWEVKRLKYIARTWFSNVDKHTVEGEIPVKLCNYVDVYYHDYIRSTIEFMNATANPNEIAGFELRQGDILITKDSESWDDIAIPAYVAEELPRVLCGYHLAQIRPDPNYADGRYFFRAFGARGINDQFQVEATGITRYALGKLSLDGSLFTIPPLPEQRAIANFLDKETSRIDALVAKKERLIELLKEKRAALISHAVTKGLNPDAMVRNSEMEWLGEIPEHWEVRPVWSLFRLGRGRVISHEEIHEHQGSFPVYSSQTEDDGVMGYINTYDFDGDHLTWTTDGAKAGTVFARSGKFNCTNVCGTLMARKPEGVDLRFIRDSLCIATAWFVRHDINPKLMNNVMARIRIQFPPPSEQRAIANFLERETDKIDVLANKIEEAIARLKEYRAALIAAAVTGKIDIRGYRDTSDISSQ